MNSQMTSQGAVESGNRKIAWARNHMPVLAAVRGEFVREQPLQGRRIAMALHVEAKTAVLVETLAAAGARVAVTGCNPLSTQDDVSAALDTRENISSYAEHNCSNDEYYAAMDRVLDLNPDITIDDGADLIFKIHTERPEMLKTLRGGCEETTTGIHRLQSMEADGALKMPVIAVNDASTKFLFDNRYGTGQSAWDGIMRNTNLLVAGKTAVIGGYGWCGKGAALRALGLGANVIVTEIDPVRALEARMDGHRVMPMIEAAPIGDIFLTTTGNRDIIHEEHFKVIKNGAVLANAGHFNVEINMQQLQELAQSVTPVRDNIIEYNLGDRKVNVLAEGRLVNLAAGDGHPAEVMDLSFADQALGVKYIAENTLPPGVHTLPRELDIRVAELKLESLGIRLDTLTPAQSTYMTSWSDGT